MMWGHTNGHTCSCAYAGVRRQLCVISSLLPLLGSPGIKLRLPGLYHKYLPTKPSCGPLNENSNGVAVTFYLGHQHHLVLLLLFLRLINSLSFAQVSLKLVILLPQYLRWLGL